MVNGTCSRPLGNFLGRVKNVRRRRRHDDYDHHNNCYHQHHHQHHVIWGQKCKRGCWMNRNYVCVDTTVSPELSSSIYVIFSRREYRMRQMLIV
jgi:hypothetical protein